MSEKTLTNLVKETVFYYVKFYYDKYLKDNLITIMDDKHIDLFIQTNYTEKEKDLREYVRKSLKKNLGDGYNNLAVENILLEIFKDPAMAKERIRIEIVDYQYHNYQKTTHDINTIIT